jgi:hypothetical protein
MLTEHTTGETPMFEAILLYLALATAYIQVPLGYLVAYLHTPLQYVMVPLGAVVNRVRGGGYLPVQDPPRSGLKMWVCAVIMTLLACVYWPPLTALAIGAGLVIWDSALPWGRYYTFNRHPRTISGEPMWAERIIEAISDVGGTRRDRVAFFIRNLIAFALATAALALSQVEPSLVVSAVTTGAFSALWSALTVQYAALLWFIPAAALIQNLSYEIGWRIADYKDGPGAGTGIHYCEHLMGAAFGAMIGFGAAI